MHLLQVYFLFGKFTGTECSPLLPFPFFLKFIFQFSLPSLSSVWLCLQRLHPVLVCPFESRWGPVVLHVVRWLAADDRAAEIQTCWHWRCQCGVLWHHPNPTHTLHRPQGCICKVNKHCVFISSSRIYEGKLYYCRIVSNIMQEKASKIMCYFCVLLLFHNLHWLIVISKYFSPLTSITTTTGYVSRQIDSPTNQHCINNIIPLPSQIIPFLYRGHLPMCLQTEGWFMHCPLSLFRQVRRDGTLDQSTENVWPFLIFSSLGTK